MLSTNNIKDVKTWNKECKLCFQFPGQLGSLFRDSRLRQSFTNLNVSKDTTHRMRHTCSTANTCEPWGRNSMHVCSTHSLCLQFLSVSHSRSSLRLMATTLSEKDSVTVFIIYNYCKSTFPLQTSSERRDSESYKTVWLQLGLWRVNCQDRNTVYWTSVFRNKLKHYKET